MPNRLPNAEQNIRRRVLLPLGTTLVIFLVLFLAVFQVYLQRELSRKLDDHIDSVERLYKDLLLERSAVMQSFASQIQKDKTLQQAMMRMDRQLLQEKSNPIFRELLRNQNITHFYFHTNAGVNLLRVHKPERFGDQIERLTMKQARSGIQVAAGAEMGPLGTFTLRVVVPWFADERLIGFIELGEEIEPLLKKIAEQTDSQMAILIRKQILEKDSWEEGRQMLGRSAGWDLLSEHVVTAVTEAQLVGSIDQHSSKPDLAGWQVVTLSLLNQQYRGRYLPLIDASSTQVGVMLVLQNAHETLNDHRFAIVLITIFCILLGSGLYASAYAILGRTEHALEATRQSLLDEIDKTHNANTQLGLEIGEKRAAEQALKKAHDELEKRVVERTLQLDQQKRLMENLISNIPSYVAWKNLDGQYIGCNIGYAKLAGSSEEAIAGKVDAELDWSAEFRLTLAAVDKEVLVENRAVLGREVIDETPDKKRVYICNAVPLKNENGQLLGMVSILQDITEQKERQQLLEETLIESRQANDRITGVMQSVDDALIVVDAADNILLMNESACTLLRLNPAEVLGKKVSSAIWLGSMRDKVVDVLRKREGGVQFDFEIGDDNNPSSLVMQARSSVLLDPQGRYEGMIFLARDVTRDRSMDRLKSDFISVAAHELRTPLATILGFSELLLDNNLGSDTDRKEYVQTIYEKADSLSRLLDGMLDISRIESGHGLELFIEPVSVEALFTPVLKQYQKRIADRQFTVGLDDSELLVKADPEKIAQVLENLLSNSVKYSESGSKISIVGKATIRGYMLSISDEGIGMTPEQVKHSFDKFYRGDNADKAVKGTGLGLTIVKHIIDEHQGSIQLESRPDKGTRVHFLLPIA